MPNQRDVAKVAGVSSASVSRYLTNPDLVKPATAERIQKAINDLEYKLDYFARSLKTGRSYHVGILLPGIGPFYWEIVQGIQDSLTRSGYFNTIFYTRDIDTTIHSSREMLSNFLNNNMIEGIIFFPLNTPGDMDILRDLKKVHEHIVIVDRDMDAPEFDQVFIDNYQAGRLAAEAFLELGHRQFLFLHGMEVSYAAVMRRNGFYDRLEDDGITLDEDRIIRGDYTSATAYRMTRERLPDMPPFTGVFAVSDSSAVGFLRAAMEHGLECPDDYSLIGFDNNEEFTPYTRPSLTTFQQPLNEMGRIAAERLIRQIDGQASSGRTILQTSFIHRESLADVPK
ncbi:MAG: LacI family DNA-binding transcriptional regulator [Spirochaetaceae bacterium]|nr:LacI family DNA-binding transcriptional regulator [Spirochaetaceae bacterium]MDT8297354.1 LacI family DNA-binding transcriptional regulator [Spirochaetaceae bacterium]